MQMVVVIMVLTGYHRVAAYTMQSAWEHAIGAETSPPSTPLSFVVIFFFFGLFSSE